MDGTWQQVIAGILAVLVPALIKILNDWWDEHKRSQGYGGHGQDGQPGPANGPASSTA